MKTLSYYYEVIKGRYGTRLEDYRKVNRQIIVKNDPCPIVCKVAPEGVCKRFELTVCGDRRKIIIDDTQVSQFS